MKLLFSIISTSIGILGQWLINNYTSSTIVLQEQLVFASFYTIFINCVSFFFLLFLFIKKNNANGIHTNTFMLYIAAANLLLICFYLIIMLPNMNLNGWEMLVDYQLHIIAPSTVIITMYKLLNPRLISKKSIWFLLALQLVYLVWYFLACNVTKYYPYSFLSIQETSIEMIIINLLILLLAYFFFCFVFLKLVKKTTNNSTI